MEYDAAWLSTTRLDRDVVEEFVEMLVRDPRTRKVAEIAHRTGRAFSAVDAEFTDEDLYWDSALAALEHQEGHMRCGQCGTRPKDFELANGRPAPPEKQSFRLESWTCVWCMEQDELVEKAPEKERKFVRVTTVTREDGDPFP